MEILAVVADEFLCFRKFPSNQHLTAGSCKYDVDPFEPVTSIKPSKRDQRHSIWEESQSILALCAYYLLPAESSCNHGVA